MAHNQTARDRKHPNYLFKKMVTWFHEFQPWTQFSYGKNSLNNKSNIKRGVRVSLHLIWLKSCILQQEMFPLSLSRLFVRLSKILDKKDSLKSFNKVCHVIRSMIRIVLAWAYLDSTKYLNLSVKQVINRFRLSALS